MATKALIRYVERRAELTPALPAYFAAEFDQPLSDFRAQKLLISTATAGRWSASLRWVPYALHKAAACARAAGRKNWAPDLATRWYHDTP